MHFSSRLVWNSGPTKKKQRTKKKLIDDANAGITDLVETANKVFKDLTELVRRDDIEMRPEDVLTLQGELMQFHIFFDRLNRGLLNMHLPFEERQQLNKEMEELFASRMRTTPMGEPTSPTPTQPKRTKSKRSRSKKKSAPKAKAS